MKELDDFKAPSKLRSLDSACGLRFLVSWALGWLVISLLSPHHSVRLQLTISVLFCLILQQHATWGGSNTLALKLKKFLNAFGSFHWCLRALWSPLRGVW